MDPLRMQAYKIHAIKKHKRQQFMSNVLLYSLSALTCTLFCSSPLWYPPFCATFNVIFFFSIPKICSFFLTSKVLFIVVNLIVIFLVGESKFFGSNTKDSASYGDVCYEKSKCKSPKRPKIQAFRPPQEMNKGICESYEAKKSCELYKEKVFDSYGEGKVCESYVEQRKTEFNNGIDHEEEKEENLEGDEELCLPTEELNKLADDFIARINRQRRLEAEFCRG